jgi:tRNA (guanine-N7-)-methyltransferase
MSSQDDASGPLRPVRSFVRREGRITRAQEQALAELWPVYGIESDVEPIDLTRLFGRKAPITMELGFGNGETLVQVAVAEPHCDFLGVEVYRPGVGRLLRRVRELGLPNVRVFCDDAVDVLTHRIAKESLTKLLIFFPDPWPKKRHHKRRLIQPGFARLASERLMVGGTLHVATDREDYAMHILYVLGHVVGLRNMAGENCFAQRPGYRPVTKFECRGQALGHRVWDLLFERVR